jgi:hypothetical protein
MKEQLAFHADKLAIWANKYPDDLTDYGPYVEELVKEVVATGSKT